MISKIMADGEYSGMTQIEHYLKFPELVLSQVNVLPDNRWIYNAQTKILEYVNIPYSFGLERLFLEALHNAADNVLKSRNNNINPGVIKVNITTNMIKIYNEGRPISCNIQPNTNMYIPTFIFGKLMTSSNYNNSQTRQTAGTYGLGIKCTNLFSIYFRVVIINLLEGKKFTQVWKNNMSIVEDPIIIDINPSDYACSSTSITFVSDFHRFYDSDDVYGYSGKREYSDTTLRSYMKHCIDASFTANIAVHFNNIVFDCTGIDGINKYASYYAKFDKHLIMESKDSVCILMDMPSTGFTVSFVNSVINAEGGTHIDKWKNASFKKIIADMKKKYHLAKFGIDNVSEHIGMILSCRLTNPRFKHQTKDKLISPSPTLSDTITVDCKALETWKAYQMIDDTCAAHVNNMTKTSNGQKKENTYVPKLVDAEYAGTNQSYKCVLFVTEGDSAANFAIKGTANGALAGALPFKGKLLNVSNCTNLDYINNTEITALKQALGLQEGIDYTIDANRNSSLRYGKLRIISDQDPDGHHIRGLIYNYFRVKFPSLLTIGFVDVMETPLMRIKYRSTNISFYYEHEYISWLKDINIDDAERTYRQKANPIYYKGLGSSDDEDLLDAFKASKITVYKYDNNSEKLLSMAYDGDNSDMRKEWVMSWNPDTNRNLYSETMPKDTLSYMIMEPLCHHAYINNQRMLPCIVDGLKECQRKVVAVLLTMPRDSSKKVSQLKGVVADKMHYRYGEHSLYGTIVELGNYYAGSNNIPLIKAKGQYDSRNGTGAAQDRYIFASPSPVLRNIFRPEDECILEYKSEGKVYIEPLYYYPILPLFLVNGVLGIATGFSTRIPAYNPGDLYAYIVWWLKIKTGVSEIDSLPRPEIKPWYKNYQGKIEKINDRWYSFGSFEEITSNKAIKDIMITELPVSMTIKRYRGILDKLKNTPLADEEKYMSIKGDNIADASSTKKTKKSVVPMCIETYKAITNTLIYKHQGATQIEIIPKIKVYKPRCLYKKSDPLRSMFLRERISDTNIVLLNKKYIPTQYEHSVYNAFNEYCSIRYDAYIMRRTTMMNNWKDQISQLKLKIRFIQDNIDGKILLKDANNKPKSKATLYDEVSKLGYSTAFLDIPMYTLTIDGIDHIKKEISRIRDKWTYYKNTSPANLWLLELQELIQAMQ